VGEPLLGRLFELRGDRARLRESERAGRTTDFVGLATELGNGVDIVSRGDESLGQLRYPAQLVSRSLQVSLPHAGGEPEVVVLAHGLQDITSFIFGL